MKFDAGAIELKKATIICDDWMQLGSDQFIRLVFCPNNWNADLVEGFIRIICNENNNLFVLEFNGVVDYLSEIYRLVYPLSVHPSRVIVNSNYTWFNNSILLNMYDVLEVFKYLDKFLIRSDLLLPFV